MVRGLNFLSVKEDSNVRIAIAGVSVEALIGSPRPTGVEAIQTYLGQELLDGDLWLVRGMVKRLRLRPEVEIVPLLWATALPGGALTQENYDQIKCETLKLLADKGPFDGVLLAEHGALEVVGYNVHGDTDFIVSVRKVIGDVPLGIAFDLHGNLTPEIAHAGTVFSALRTAPHRDDSETGFRVADQLLKVLDGGVKPTTALVQIPMLMPGEKAVTRDHAAKALYDRVWEYDKIQGVIQTILMVGFGWNDRSWSGMTTMVTTDDNPALARELAERLATEVWAMRDEFVYPMETASLEDGVAWAKSSGVSPVFLSDSGDNTTAGAPGDLTIVLQHLLCAGGCYAFVPGITAPKVVQQALRAGVGAQIEVVLGDEHISLDGPTMRVSGTVEAVGLEFNIGGFQPYRSKERGWAKIRFNSVIATFHDLSVGVTTPMHFEAMGEDINTHQIVVLKIGYLHPQLEALTPRHILLLTPGMANLDYASITWTEARRPMYPLDAGMSWEAKAVG